MKKSKLEEIVSKAKEEGWFFNLQYVNVKRWGGWRWVATFAKPAELMTKNYNSRNEDMLTAVKEADKFRQEAK